MLIKGQKIQGPNEEVIVIPRGEENIVFTARAVLDMGEFESLCPTPKPPVRRMRNGEKIEEINDTVYLARQDEHSTKYMAYMILKSLEATEGLEWETVDMDDPNTWQNWQDELTKSGFSRIEINRITMAVMTANCLNEAKLDQARKLFLLGRQEQKDLLSQTGEPNTTPSGVLANGSG